MAQQHSRIYFAQISQQGLYPRLQEKEVMYEGMVVESDSYQ
jgi:hypothetical protein